MTPNPQTPPSATEPVQPVSRFARALSEAGSPALVVFLLPAAVAWYGTGHRLVPTVGWGLLVAVFSSVLPMVFIVRGARRGRWQGHHVRERETRFVPMLACLGSSVAGFGLLVLAGAPAEVVALDVAMVCTLVVCIAVTRYWKISLHATVASGALATMVLLYGPFWLAGLVPLALVGWSRVRLADHTWPQVLAGSALGPTFGGPLFLLVTQWAA